jgi:hypothetical protein
MTLNTTNLGASSPLPEGGKSLRIPMEHRVLELVSLTLRPSRRKLSALGALTRRMWSKR